MLDHLCLIYLILCIAESVSSELDLLVMKLSLLVVVSVEKQKPSLATCLPY